MSVTEAPTARSDDTPVQLSAAARSRAATRERLRAAGRELLAERGLHAVTTHQIARRAGVAAGTFYLHFKDKQALCRDLALEAIGELRARLQQAARPDTDEAAFVRAHAAALVGFAEENRPLIRMLFGGDAAAARAGADALDTLAESVAKVRSARGRVPRGVALDVLAQAVVGMCARVIVWWVEDPTRASREQLIDTLTRIQLHGTQPE